MTPLLRVALSLGIVVSISRSSVCGARELQPTAQPDRQKAAIPAASAEAFYFKYRRALAEAQSLQDLKVWMARKGYSLATSTSPTRQVGLFNAMKAINGSIASVRVTNRAANSDTVVLRLTGVDSRDQQLMKGAALIVRERRDWRLAREDWRTAR